MTPSTPTIFCVPSRNGAAIIEEPDIEKSLFSEPMKMRTPSPPSARVSSSITSVCVSRSAKSRRMRSRSSTALRSSSRLAWPRTISWRASGRPPEVATPASTSRAVMRRARAPFGAARLDLGLDLAQVRPRMRALRKLPASISAEGGRPAAGRAAGSRPSRRRDEHHERRVGSSRTNSTCFSRGFDLPVATTPAPRETPESSDDASASAVSSVWPVAAARICASMRSRSSAARIADLEQRVDEEAQARLGRQPPGAGVRRVDQPREFEVRHDVAHARRRQRHRQDSGDVARPDRLAGGKVVLDDLPKISRERSFSSARARA
jgi:hypothetical protein